MSSYGDGGGRGRGGRSGGGGRGRGEYYKNKYGGGGRGRGRGGGGSGGGHSDAPDYSSSNSGQKSACARGGSYDDLLSALRSIDGRQYPSYHDIETGHPKQQGSGFEHKDGFVLYIGRAQSKIDFNFVFVQHIQCYATKRSQCL
jgi:hypothetical protein